MAPFNYTNRNLAWKIDYRAAHLAEQAADLARAARAVVALDRICVAGVAHMTLRRAAARKLQQARNHNREAVRMVWEALFVIEGVSYAR